MIRAKFLIKTFALAALLTACTRDVGDLLADKKITETASPTAVAAASVLSVSSPTTDGSYTSGTIMINVTFSTAVSVTGTPQLVLATGSPTTTNINYTSGSGSTTLSFSYSIIASNFSSDLDYASASALVLNGGSIVTSAGGEAVSLNLPAPGSLGSLGANKNFVIGNPPPTVSNVTASTADGTYGTGAVISIRVVFSQAVTVTGTPQLILATGSPATSTAHYTSGSGSANLVFSYTVAAGNTSADLDYATTGSLVLNGGTIMNGGNNAVLTLPSPGAANSLAANKNIVIGDAATVTNVTSSNADGVYVLGGSISVQITFSAAVTVTGTPQLKLQTSASSTTAINYASGSGSTTLTFTYTVVAGDNSADLDYAATSALSLNGGTIKNGFVSANLDLPAPGAAGSLGANKGLIVDTGAPTVVNVTSPNADGAYSVGQTITVHVIFSEPVAVSGTPRIRLVNGGTPPQTWVDYVSMSGANTLVFQYVVASGDSTADFDYQNATSLNLPGGTTVKDAAGNDADLTLPAAGSAGSLGANKNISFP